MHSGTCSETNTQAHTPKANHTWMSSQTHTEGHYHDTPGTRISVWVTLRWMTVGRIVRTWESLWCDWWNWSRVLCKKECVHISTYIHVLCHIHLAYSIEMCRLLILLIYAHARVHLQRTWHISFQINSWVQLFIMDAKNEGTSNSTSCRLSKAERKGLISLC